MTVYAWFARKDKFEETTVVTCETGEVTGDDVVNPSTIDEPTPDEDENEENSSDEEEEKDPREEEKDPRQEENKSGEEENESGEGDEVESRSNDEQAEETGETQSALQHETESPHTEEQFTIDVAARTAPVEGPPIPAIGDAARAESAEAHAHLVEAPGGEAVEEPEEVRCLRMSLPDGGNASVVDIAKQFQSEHGNGNDEEDDCSKDGDMEISGLAEMSKMVEKFEMSHKAKNDVAKVGEKEKESGDVQTETKKNKRERKCDGKEGGPLKKAKGSNNMRSPIRTRGHKKEAAEKEAAENRTARAQKKAGEQKKACEQKKKANKGGKERV
ncbi:hypothetical protein F2Q69_00007754 [Brassica cretica]|uniref:Uncharacterized protein n=1 Tax=Brassica cretica TaxID=69181 RepID=A0A8S9PKP8_BRACR|nr:hypothetical protein F2Q69_00007754 [Brassica cretica]